MSTACRTDAAQGGGTLEAQLKRRAASGAGNTSGGSDTPSDGTGSEVLTAMMLSQPHDENPQARGVLFDAHPMMRPRPGRHYFVPDASGYYCLACNLPRANGRHVRREAA